MRLDTAGVERKPPLPTISLETLLAAAILNSKISIMILIVAFVNSSDNKIFAASDRKKCFISSNEDDHYEDQDDIYQPDDNIRSLCHEKPPIPANHKS